MHESPLQTIELALDDPALRDPAGVPISLTMNLVGDGSSIEDIELSVRVLMIARLAPPSRLAD
jgi:hypothetical protein